jgi:hypothetical protein
VKSPSEFIALSTAQMRKQFDIACAQNKELSRSLSRSRLRLPSQSRQACPRHSIGPSDREGVTKISNRKRTTFDNDQGKPSAKLMFVTRGMTARLVWTFAIGRFCCKSHLRWRANSDPVLLTRTLAGLDTQLRKPCLRHISNRSRACGNGNDKPRRSIH